MPRRIDTYLRDLIPEEKFDFYCMVRDFADAEIAPHLLTWEREHVLVPDDCIQRMGELGLFGLPIAGEASVDGGNGQTVQYFERARFECHPENAGTRYEVLLGRLGAEATGQRSRTAIQPASESRPRGDVPGRGQRLEIVTDSRHDGHPNGARDGRLELNVRRIVIVLDEDDPPLTIRDVSTVAMDQI